MTENEKLEKLVDEMWVQVMKHIENVLKECNLLGMSEITYSKNPSMEERLEVLGVMERVFAFLENYSKHFSFDNRDKISSSKTCITMFSVLLGSVKNHDNETFDFAKGFLERHCNS